MTAEPLRLSAAYWTCADRASPPAALFDALASYGYEAVEMVPPDLWPAARAAGLALANVSAPGMTDGLNRRERHAGLLPEIRDALARAGAAGIGQVIVFSGNRDGRPDEEGLRTCADALAALVPDAEAAGVTMVFETLNAFDHVNYLADTSAAAREVVRRVGSPRLRWLMDAYHQAKTGESPAEEFLREPGLVGHIHVAGSPNRDFPARDGEPDYPALVRAARSAGYRGYWGMEFDMPAGAAGLAELAAAAALFRSY